MADYVDAMISPFNFSGSEFFKIFPIDDAQFGPHGHALSEYSQLLGLNDKFEEIVQGYEFVRLFQYRKFVSACRRGRGSSWTYARWLPPERLSSCASEFHRHCDRELVSKPLGLTAKSGGMAMQYDKYHNIEDLFLFSLFLVREGVLSETSIAEFITQPDLIPSGTLGVFRRTTLKPILEKLALAAKFLESPLFIPRDGPQRRNVGFLLERLNSYLIFVHMREAGKNIATGQIIVLHDSPHLTISN